MKSVILKNDTVSLFLTSPQSKVRVSDESGNQVSRPTLAKNIPAYCSEWMITNESSEALAKSVLDDKERSELVGTLLNNVVADDGGEKSVDIGITSAQLLATPGY